jgi:hypothetical protein
MKEHVGQKRYEPVLHMMRKIRILMGAADERYQPKGTVEIDDAYMSVAHYKKRDRLGNVINPKPKKQSRGRGTERKAAVFVMVESDPAFTSDPIKRKINRRMGRLRMSVVEDFSAASVNYNVFNAISPAAHVISDGWQGYSDVNDLVQTHIPRITPAKSASEMLPWVHKMIGNCKAQLRCVHTGVGKEYLQPYLNEFCYRVNRRFKKEDMFERLLYICLTRTWYD